MLSAAFLVLSTLSFSSVQPFAFHEQLRPVALCRALERVQPGDQIPVVVSGVYAVDYLYDPEELECRLDIDPFTCVELAPSLEVPPEFTSLHRDYESFRVRVTFRGTLFGPQLVAAAVEPSRSIKARLLKRMAAANNLRYCGNRYRTKLVVESILFYGPVPDDTPWPMQRQEPRVEPAPVEMTLPEYPPGARMIDYEGVVLVAVTVVAGEVTQAEVQFGDPALVHEAVTNVQTWRFSPDVSTTFTVEYDFRLENRPRGSGGNAALEMRLPGYVRVTGQRINF